jgi:hypothetical protein
MKKVIILSALLGSTSLMALSGEFAYLYKDSRIMGMGGANVAVGSYSTSIFSNPAGLATLKKEDGFIVELLGLKVAATKDIQNFVDDLDAAGDDTDKITQVIEDYAGDHFHASVDNYSSVSKNSDLFAWSVGLLAAADVNYATHPNDTGLMETTSRGYGGVLMAVAKPFNTEYGRFDIGIGAKFITQQSYEGTITAAELAGDYDLVDVVEEKTSSGIGVDLGLTYHPFMKSAWHPAIGVSLLNIGSMDMDDNYGGQPMTLNFGASISPEVSFLNKLVVAVDYVDALNANTIRVYEYTDDQITSYTDSKDSDMMKRLRLGVGIGLVDSTYFGTTLNVGMYQGAYTAGLDLTITVLKLNFATYEEQVGSGSVDIPDRRYMAQLGLGW